MYRVNTQFTQAKVFWEMKETLLVIVPRINWICLKQMGMCGQTISMVLNPLPPLHFHHHYLSAGLHNHLLGLMLTISLISVLVL